jgi:hypothetical protein
MSAGFAPDQLPLAPKPFRDELLSSWLLRLAARNAISLTELLESLRWRYPKSLDYAQPLDYSISEPGLRALSKFGRAPLAKLRDLDLSRRLPRLNSAWLLRFAQPSGRCPRGNSWRVRYAFCPQCLAEQTIAHIRWDWCFAALIRCAKHRVLLLEGCPTCGSLDPLPFSADPNPKIRCVLCAADLTRFSQKTIPDDDAISVMETAYRATLATPQVLCKASDQALQNFIEDMLHLLYGILSTPPSLSASFSFGPLMAPRSSLVAIIAQLFRNATPATDARLRRAGRRYGKALWSKLFLAIPEPQGRNLERSSYRWPPVLRQVFVSAVNERRQKRHPYSSYSPQAFSPRFRYNQLLSALLLGAPVAHLTQKSGL